jgi:hypothetical protein
MTGFGIFLEAILLIGLINLFSGPRRSAIAAPLQSIAQSPLQSMAPTQPSAPVSIDVIRRQTFEQLQSLLVNYPSVKQAAIANPDMLAKNLLPLFAPLDQLLRQWGYAAIGQPWETVSFDPQIHQPDVAAIAPGETVYIRFIGYRCGDEILCPAKVSRQLPSSSPSPSSQPPSSQPPLAGQS